MEDEKELRVAKKNAERASLGKQWETHTVLNSNLNLPSIFALFPIEISLEIKIVCLVASH